MRPEKDRPVMRGFTLLEVLISLAIFSVITAALYSTFFLSERAVRGMDDSLLRLHELRTTMDVMEREIEAAAKGKPREEKAFEIKDRDYFGMQASELSFRTFSAPSAGASGISYYVEKDEDNKLNLIKKLTPLNRKDGIEAPVLEDIESFSVEIKERGSWLKVWNRDDIPVEIRITIDLKLGDRSMKLSQTVKPRLGKII